MPKYKVVVECHGPSGTDVHCYTTEGKTDREAVDKTVKKCAACYPEYDEITPTRLEYVGK